MQKQKHNILDNKLKQNKNCGLIVFFNKFRSNHNIASPVASLLNIVAIKYKTFKAAFKS